MAPSEIGHAGRRAVSALRPRCGRSRAPPPRWPPRRRPAACWPRRGSRRSSRGGGVLTAPQLLVDAEQLDVAAVLGQERPDRDEGRLHPVVERLGVEALHQQEAGHQLVLDEGGHQPGRVLPGQLYDPGETGAVELGDQAQDLLGQVDGAGVGRRSAARRVPARSDRRRPGGSVAQASLPVLRRPGRRDWPPGWGSASSSAPCPCRGTCAPRRAGTGRSCAPPA